MYIVTSNNVIIGLYREKANALDSVFSMFNEIDKVSLTKIGDDYYIQLNNNDTYTILRREIND